MMTIFRHLKTGYRVKFGETNEERIKDFQTKKIWIVVSHGKLYFFKRFQIILLLILLLL